MLVIKGYDCEVLRTIRDGLASDDRMAYITSDDDGMCLLPLNVP